MGCALSGVMPAIRSAEVRTLGQLQKSQGAQNNTDLLDSAHQLSEFSLILGRHFNTKGSDEPSLVWAKTFPNRTVLLQKLQAVRHVA
jgi:hypothetical protein